MNPWHLIAGVIDVTEDQTPLEADHWLSLGNDIGQHMLIGRTQHWLLPSHIAWPWLVSSLLTPASHTSGHIFRDILWDMMIWKWRPSHHGPRSLASPQSLSQVSNISSCFPHITGHPSCCYQGINWSQICYKSLLVWHLIITETER